MTLDVPLRSPRGARVARSRWVVSPRMRSPRALTLLGLSWRGADPGTLEIRVRRRGRWSRWVELPGIGGHAPDDAGKLKATDGAFVGGARTFQVRARRSPAAVRAHGVAVTKPFAGISVRSQAQAPASGAPAMVTRAQWRAQAPRSAPSYGRVDLAFVHHTVSANDYTAGESPQVVRAIQHYHRNTLGWDDVGYNFLVDRFGTIYEGRAGGIEEAVIGAQTQGWNSVSTGVASIGTHSTERVTPQTFEAIAQTLAYKLSVHQVPTEGEVTLVSSGGGSNRHPAGRRVVFERISGHRDGCSTSCPGNALFNQLPALRTRASELATGTGFSLRLRTARAAYRKPVTASGRLAFPDGSAPGGLTVEVQALDAGGWRSQASAVTATDGAFSVPVALDYTRRLRARFAGDGARPELISRPVRLSVRSAVTVQAPKRARARRVVKVRGTVNPVKQDNRHRVQVKLERRVAGRWVVVVSRYPYVRSGRFAARLPRLSRGRYRITAGAYGDRLNLPSRSPKIPLRVV
ncbi:MAG: peptidoglycan recognition protein [Actinomycetota bacterium]